MLPTPPDMVAVQEHHRRGDGVVNARSWLHQAGMTGVFEDALPGAKLHTRRGGTAVLVKQYVGITAVPLDAEAAGPARGRVVRAHVNAVCKGGIMIYSVYGHASGGLAANGPLLEQLHRLLRTEELPWLVAADWNLQVEELQGVHFDATVGGTFFKTEGSTCSTGHRCINFFLVQQRLVHAVQSVAILSDAPTSPHWPVEIRLKGVKMSDSIPMAKTWKCFPTAWPMGPRREPSKPGWTSESGNLDTHVDLLWKEWETLVLSPEHTKEGQKAFKFAECR
eukprot:746263-Amphidinium_carterae.2